MRRHAGASASRPCRELRTPSSLYLATARAVAILSLAACLLATPSASAAGAYVFDPVLSLEGECKGEDGVADPGCPYPTPEAGGPSHFNDVCGVATDPQGDVYVASGAPGQVLEGHEGRIDVFDPQGKFLTSVKDENVPCGISVDSHGVIYATERANENKLVRYVPEPGSYPPTPASEYGTETDVLLPNTFENTESPNASAVDPSNDHVYAASSNSVVAFKADGGRDGVNEVQRLAVDAEAGSFKLIFYGSASFRFDTPFLAGTGTLTAGSPELASIAYAVGTGDLTADSTGVTGLAKTAGTFEIGRSISGAGIAPGTTITELTQASGGAFLRLSQPATASGAGVALVSEGTNLEPVGSSIVGPGIPPGTTILSKDASGLTLSNNATASGGIAFTTGKEGQETAAIPFDASAAEVQVALEALPGIEPGDVSVSGGPGGPGAVAPYLITFEGKLADADINQIGAEGSALSGAGASAVLTTAVPGFTGRNAGPFFVEGSEERARVIEGLDVYGVNHDVYATGRLGGGNFLQDEQRILIFDGADGHLERTIDGSDVPGGFHRPGTSDGLGALAVDQANGNVYVVNEEGEEAHQVVDAFDPEGHYLGRLPEPPAMLGGRPYSDIAIDDSIPGELGYDSPNPGQVYVGSGVAKKRSHLFSFKRRVSGPPEVRNQVAIPRGETEATLTAELDPGSLATAYHFEYTTQAAFEAAGYDGAVSVPVPDAGAGEGSGFLPVSRQIASLLPGTTYRFRLVASNEECTGTPTEGEGKPCEEGEDATFSTYAAEAPVLPDDRGYELVTPADTGGRIPSMSELGGGFVAGGFSTALASPDGRSLVFGTEGGSLPGTDANGLNDTYEAVRGEDGIWRSLSNGLSARQSQGPIPGGLSSDHGFSFWQVTGCKGSLSLCPIPLAAYIRRAGGVVDPACSPEPDGLFELVGCGSLGIEPAVKPAWISPGGGHVIFAVNGAIPGSNRTQLEPCAAPTGTSAIYDRTADGVTHCISVKPGSASFSAGENAVYQGASADGSTVAFKVNGTLYVRVGDMETLEVDAATTTFAGLSRDGSRLFYLKAGDIFAFDTSTGATVEVGSGGESTAVNVSSDGTRVYFVSPAVLTGGEGNGQGGSAITGEENLYDWDGSSVHFVAIVTPLDVSGREIGGNGSKVGGLGLWTSHVAGVDQGPTTGPAGDPSRTTPDGSVLVFESHANLTDYDSGGRSEVYRYDAGAEAGGRLRCVSCNPTAAAAVSGAQLQSDPAGQQARPFPPVNELTPVANVTEDGRKVFFQSADRLVPRDVDGRVDVYEWAAQGTGGCQREAGCINLISSGRSAGDDYLYAATPSGSDVFLESGDLLVPRDVDGTPSIYDAREGGGEPPLKSPPAECLGEACQPPALAPNDTTLASSSFRGPGNPGPQPSRRCAQGKRKAKGGGSRTRCVKSHKKAHQRKNRRHHANRRAAR